MNVPTVRGKQQATTARRSRYTRNTRIAIAAYTYSIIGSSLFATSSLIAASTPALPAASLTFRPATWCVSRKCLTASITPLMVVALWSAR